MFFTLLLVIQDQFTLFSQNCRIEMIMWGNQKCFLTNRTHSSILSLRSSMSDLVAYVDGGSRGNPGPSGIGIVIDSPTDGAIRIAKWIGHQDNNVAEYLALLEALQCALGLKAKTLHVFSDSE